MSIEAAIFFDNKKEHLDEVHTKHRNIKLVKVPDAKGSYFPKPLSMNSGPLKTMIDSLGPNAYVDLLKSSGIDTDAYDPVSGIEQNHIRILNRWLTNTKDSSNNSRAAIFDWDRTLTKVEGFYPLYKGQERHMFEDTLLYLFGGHKRLLKIRGMLQHLATEGVEIFILTNNEASITTFYKRMIHVLSPHIPLENIICATLLYRGHKGLAFENHTKLSTVRILETEKQRRTRTTRTTRTRTRTKNKTI
jgi:hypothetical protein